MPSPKPKRLPPRILTRGERLGSTRKWWPRTGTVKKMYRVKAILVYF